MNERSQGRTDGLHEPGRRFDGVIAVDAPSASTGTELEFPVVAFGPGDRPLVIIPGLSDGLATVEGKSFMLSLYYRTLPDRYRVYVISRPRELPEQYPIREMAADYAALLAGIGLGSDADPERGVDLWGISQGGMIAQWLAIDNGHLIRKLCLAVTTPHATETVRQTVGSWMEMVRNARYGELGRDTMRKTFTPKYLRRYALMWPFLGLFGKPRSSRRFLIQADACMRHDARSALDRISVPTLVIGGGADRVVGEGTSEALAEQIPGARLELYPELGHGTFEQAPDGTKKVMEFFASSRSR